MEQGQCTRPAEALTARKVISCVALGIHFHVGKAGFLDNKREFDGIGEAGKPPIHVSTQTYRKTLMAKDTSKHARLYFKDIELGDVFEEDADFPNLFGTFWPGATTSNSRLYTKIQSYIAYSVAADKLMHEGTEAEWEAFAAEHEPQYIDLIETDDWHLVYADQIEPILIPNFCRDNGIVWRWNVHPHNETSKTEG